MDKSSRYTLAKQRDTYIVTLQNDVELKSGRQDEQIKFFNQLGAGRRKIFNNLWGYTLFRILINLLLPFVMMVADIFLPIT